MVFLTIQPQSVLSDWFLLQYQKDFYTIQLTWKDIDFHLLTPAKLVTFQKKDIIDSVYNDKF